MIFPCPNFRLEIVEECGSTNELLLARRSEAGFEGLAILAHKQTAGYGRRGREWWSGEGNLALSVGFRLSGSGPSSLLPFLAGLALVDLLEPILPEGVDLRLKWPNDVYLNGRKLCGMIAQARQSESCADVVLGIGLNIREAPPGGQAISLAEVGAHPPQMELAQQFLNHLEARLKSTADFEVLKREWEKHSKLDQTRMTILEEPGKIFRALRLLPTGELEVEREDGVRRTLSSENVSLRLF